MASKPLVAVVTPVLNGADHIADALQSVQDQTWPNLVHVVLDNASRDKTSEIVRSFQGRRAPVIHYQNDAVLPLQANWEAAFRLTPKDARYVRLLCHDDLLHPGCIEATVEVGERWPEARYIVSPFIEGPVADWSMKPVYDGPWPKEAALLDGGAMVRQILIDELSITGNQITMRRDLLDAFSPLVDPDYAHCDTEMVVRAAVGGKVGFTPAITAFTRIHPGQETSRSARLETAFLDALRMLVRWGPEVMAESEFRKTRTRFENIYARRLLTWRLRKPEAYAYHLEGLRAHGLSLGPGRFLAAIADWPAERFRAKSRLYAADNLPDPSLREA